jgi:ribosomal protein S18 acetylase RimI-like enzyme
MKTKSYGKDNGFTRIDLEVRTNNPEAIKLYKKHGFIIAEQNNTSLKMAFNLSANSSGKNN